MDKKKNILRRNVESSEDRLHTNVKKKYLVGKLEEKEKTTDPSFQEEKRETKRQKLIQLNASRRRTKLESAKLKGEILHRMWQAQFSLWSRFQSCQRQ